MGEGIGVGVNVGAGVGIRVGVGVGIRVGVDVNVGAGVGEFSVKKLKTFAGSVFFENFNANKTRSTERTINKIFIRMDFITIYYNKLTNTLKNRPLL